MSHVSKPQAVLLGIGGFAIAMTYFCDLSRRDSVFGRNFAATRKLCQISCSLRAINFSLTVTAIEMSIYIGQFTS